eukprot:TRINITY_DN305_c0_g1_i1.p1 TRINITY_DN305_c0_g1~~TRINITY_DN305_c0_g1_i1.p1  ORF type:complete len:164 (+),score=59.52 TRINITY_DN305_c0_g1_i1:121-612(+)
MSLKAAAGQVVKAIDWDYLARVIVSADGKREMLQLRRAFDEVSNSLETKFSAKPVTIDWETYRQKLNPEVVDSFQQSFESLNIPDYEDKFTPDYEKKFKHLLVKAEQEEEFSKKEVIRLKAELEKVQAQKAALMTQTVDDYFAKNPEVKEKIDEEIKDNYWGY